MKRSLTAAVLVTGLLSAGGLQHASADHEYEYIPNNTRFFERNSSTTCPGTLFLSIEAGSGEVGCGFQGGAPFGELYHSGAPVATTIKTYGTEASEDVYVPVYLDPTRNITGNTTVVATATTNRMAAGQIRVDITLRARTQTGQNVVLGTSSQETIVDPTNSAEVNFPFTIDPADSLDKVRLDTITIDVDIRGWHVLTGYHRLNGQSWVDLATYERRLIEHE